MGYARKKLWWLAEVSALALASGGGLCSGGATQLTRRSSGMRSVTHLPGHHAGRDAAVQTIGDRYVVFVPGKDEKGKFIQRTVQVGRLIGESYTILRGLKPGEVVVTEGSFFLRAESLRTSPG